MSDRSSRPMLARWLAPVAAIAALLAALLVAAPAFAQAEPHWHIETIATPSNLPLKGEGQIEVVLANLGDADVNGDAAAGGEEVHVSVELPENVEIVGEPEATSKGTPHSEVNNVYPTNPNGFRCQAAETTERRTARCSFGATLPPFEQLEILLKVRDNFPSTPKTAPEGELLITGGGKKSEVVPQTLNVNGLETHFGVEHYELKAENEEGENETQAGAHPFQLTTTLDLNNVFGTDYDGGVPESVASAPAPVKDVDVSLPPGLIGDPNVVARCEGVDFGAKDENTVNSCPADTAVGVATFTFNDPVLLGRYTKVVPVFNLVPPLGEPAQLGFEAEHVQVVINTTIRPGGGYGVSVTVNDSSSAVQVLSSRVTVWGAPGEAAHDQSRGWPCLGYEPVTGERCEGVGEAEPKPFLTLPTSCSAPPVSSVSGDSWPQEDGESLPLAEVSSPMPLLTGCNELGFDPTMTVEAEKHEANTPTGLRFHVHLPQESALMLGEDAESAVKETTVELPPGVLLNPSASNGLLACSENEVGYLAEREIEKTPMQVFSEAPTEGETSFCPNASKVGVVHIKSPDLPVRFADGTTGTEELEGGVYLADQDTNPFGSLFAMYIVAQEPKSGVLVKLAGEVSVSPEGQVTSTFKNTPDVPFEDLNLELFGGERASVTTPPSCGPATTDASFVPWSGTETKKAEPTFDVTSGQGGSPCEGTQPFAPSFEAGVTNTQGGAFTPFTLTIGVPQADSALKTISNMKLPSGLAAVIASVGECPEPAASEGACETVAPNSIIGVSTAESGLGGEPYTLPGKVYLTGPYDGQPFGLSAVTYADAGPYHLGKVVVRSSIAINPETAAATIDTEAARFINEDGRPQEEGKVEEFAGLPEFILGVPAQIKQLRVVVDRPDFEFNPTNCTPSEITATLKGATGEEHVSSPFNPSNCGSLPFEPKLTASVKGQGSKVDGTEFSVKVESAGLGQANIQKVDLTLPEALPSRQSTIEKACLEKVFDANPASCDEGSVIGEGIVYTPVFKDPLRGPAYLVSHGAAAFPDVEFVLQGEGEAKDVEVILDGKTDIKHGITYSKFESSPDAPFTKFESIFPQSPHSAVTSYVPEKEDFNLCKTSLSMPTEITGQNGAFISQDTKIEVTGCGGVVPFKVHKLTRAEELAKALKACRTKYKAKRKKAKRLACEKQARKKYGVKAAKKAKKKKK